MTLAAWAMTMTAQTAREEIEANKYVAASNYLDYDRLFTPQALTPAPKGYVPFYMSHYGRHGSRWLIGKDSYSSVVEPMQKARQYGKLTTKGEEVLRQLETFVKLPVPNYPTLDGQYEGAQLRLGDLSSVGERQHHGIGKRLAQNFPEIFKAKNVAIDARSTVVVRCILSMVAECEELMAANPTARIHNEVSDALQYYMNAPRIGLVKEMREKSNRIKRDFGALVKPDRLMRVLFNDQQWVADSLKADRLMSQLFEIATNMQSHDVDIDLYPLFNSDEIYDQWRTRNIRWYLDYGPAPQLDGVMPFSQKNLLRNIIETADTVSQTQATLRFGHEVCVMPLACLLELDDCGIAVNDLNELDKYWRNYKIYPMACNIQLIFYRPTKSKANSQKPMTSANDILVKALLNERECRLPIKTNQYPYYNWAELRRYYLNKLDLLFDDKESLLLQSKLGLYLCSNISRKRGADVGNATGSIHDVNIATSLTYSLNSIDNLSGNGLHLVLLLFSQSLLVVLIALLNLLIHFLQFGLTTLLDILRQGSLLLFESLTLLLQFVLH